MKKKYLIVGIISILILMVGASYAYFTSAVVGKGKRITVSANRLAVIFTDTEKIVETEITPGWNTSKTFTVENRSGGVFYYDINIDNLVNTFVTEGYLQYKITSTDGGYNMTEYVDIPKSEEARREKLASNIEIDNGSTHTYTIEFKYPNDPNVNQSDDMGKELSGSLSITESNIVIVKYKVNDKVQDTIPDKTEPYIVDKVECSNNAKGVWNEITEKVDLVGEVTQTVCIVEFKEGNTVNIITENNEVVSPVSKVVGRIRETTFEIEKREGYEIENARVTCDNGASGSITGNTITITNITKDNTCRVVTNPKIIIVTYNANGGSGVSPATDTVTYASKYKLPGTSPTRTGYTFAGWYTEASGGTEVTTNTNVTNANDHSIYAHWTINKYNVTLKVVNGTPTSETKSVEYNKSTTFTVKANSGYKLASPTAKSCTGGTLSYNEMTGVLTVSGVTDTTSCTITLVPSKATFTMNSTSCPDRVNNNSGACYVIYHKSTTVIYNGVTYTNCTINSSTMKWGSKCNSTYGAGSLFWSDNVYQGIAGGWWCGTSTCYDSDDMNSMACTVELTCIN